MGKDGVPCDRALRGLLIDGGGGCWHSGSDIATGWD